MPVQVRDLPPGSLLTRKNETPEACGSPTNVIVPPGLGWSSPARMCVCIAGLLSWARAYGSRPSRATVARNRPLSRTRRSSVEKSTWTIPKRCP